MDPFLSHVLTAIFCLAIGIYFGRGWGRIIEAQRAAFSWLEYRNETRAKMRAEFFEKLKDQAKIDIHEELRKEREAINKEVEQKFQESKEKVRDMFKGPLPSEG
jgi:polyribonucleotide nucleotidyltransferase